MATKRSSSPTGRYLSKNLAAKRGEQLAAKRGEQIVVAKKKRVRVEPTAAAMAAAVASQIQLGQRAGSVAAALGSKSRLASLLSVSPSQPTRWIDGAEKPNSENARAIVDLDYVIARAGLIWKPSVISAWLTGSNAFLDGSRPIDVLKTQGSTPVIEALDQELAGGYA